MTLRRYAKAILEEPRAATLAARNEDLAPPMTNSSCVSPKFWISAVAVLFGAAIAASAQTNAPGTAPMQPKQATVLAPTALTKYDNKFEVYGGLSFMNGQAGQDLPKRYNMGGGELMGTYWLGGPSSSSRIARNLGVAADYRFGAGTTPVLSPYYNRVLIMQHVFSGGVQYRGPRNRYAGIDFHALGGGTYGIFDNAVKNYPGGSPVSACAAQEQAGQRGTLGLYCNHVAPFATAGGSVDFNYSPKLAIRLQPDMIIEHFGTETREFFSISAGAVYRIGKR